MPQVITILRHPATGRPRVARDAILLGKDTVLAHRAAERGFWWVHGPDEAKLSALLSVAYGKRINPDDSLSRTIRRAADLLQRSPEQAALVLSALPDPLADGAERVALADRLLKAGTRPTDLEKAMRRAPLGLPPTPSYTARLALCEDGVVLGKTVVAALSDLPGERTGLAVEGREDRILALLSIARDGLAHPRALSKFVVASNALARGDASLAAIALCQIGQPPLAHTGFAKSLDLAATAMDQGFLPYDLLKGLELLPKAVGYGDWEKIVKYNEDQPRLLRKENDNHYPANSPDGHGGEFAPKNGGGGGSGAQNQQLPDAGGGGALSPEATKRAEANTQKIIDSQGAAIDGMSKEERLDVLEALKDAPKKEITSEMKAKLWEPFLSDGSLGLTVPLKGQEVIDKLDKAPIVHEIQDLFRDKKWNSLPVSQREEKLQQVVDVIADVYGLPHQYHVNLAVPSGKNRGADYDPATHTLNVDPAIGIGEYAPNLFAVITHEMTHAWQQQAEKQRNSGGSVGLRARIFDINNNDNVYIFETTDPAYDKQPVESQAHATDSYIRNQGVILGYMGRLLHH